MRRNTSGLRRGGPGRKRGVPNKATAEIKGFTQDLLTSEAYRKALTKRVIAGKSPQLEALMHYYAFGKPKERVELETHPLPIVEKILHQPARDTATVATVTRIVHSPADPKHREGL